MMSSVRGRSDRKLIELNDLHQPVGPTKAVVKEFGSFLGTLARNGALCPLDVEDWRKIDANQAIWDYTKAEMEAIETQQSEGDGSVNVFASVMGPEHPGRMRLYGRGVTKTSLKGKIGVFEPSLNATDDQLDDKIQRIVDEKMAVERKIMEDNMAEQKRMLDEQFEERQDASRKKFIAQFLVELQLSGAKFDANAILARMGSPGEASSAQRPSLQPIYRPSTGSNGGKQPISGNLIGDEDGSDDEDIGRT